MFYNGDKKRSEACESAKTTNECVNCGGRKRMNDSRMEAWKFYCSDCTSSYVCVVNVCAIACCLCVSAVVSCTFDLG